MASRKHKHLWHLTTPLMKGPGIHRLQHLLQEKGFLSADKDGVYGVHTAQAVYRAKFWLGYPKPNQQAGERLIRYLSGDSRPPMTMRLLGFQRRAKARRLKRKHKGMTKGQLVLRRACTQLGETEHPAGSNKSKYNFWYGVVGPWCAMFVTWSSVHIFKAFRRGQFAAYVPYVRAKAVLGQDGLMVTTAPQSGTLVIYDWNKDRIGDHIGIYAEEKDLRRFVPKAFNLALSEFGALKGTSEFWAVEGNTGVGNDSNGGEVMIRKRSKKDVQSFVRAS